MGYAGHTDPDGRFPARGGGQDLDEEPGTRGARGAWHTLPGSTLLDEYIAAHYEAVADFGRYRVLRRAAPR